VKGDLLVGPVVRVAQEHAGEGLHSEKRLPRLGLAAGLLYQVVQALRQLLHHVRFSQPPRTAASSITLPLFTASVSVLDLLRGNVSLRLCVFESCSSTPKCVCAFAFVFALARACARFSGWEQVKDLTTDEFYPLLEDASGRFSQ
jgi:hypothetical protein